MSERLLAQFFSHLPKLEPMLDYAEALDADHDRSLRAPCRGGHLRH